MSVRDDLIAELQRAPEDAVPIIGGAVVTGVQLVRGTFDGAKAPHFRKDPNGDAHGIIFLALTDMANGVVKRKAR